MRERRERETDERESKQKERDRAERGKGRESRRERETRNYTLKENRSTVREDGITKHSKTVSDPGKTIPEDRTRRRRCPRQPTNQRTHPPTDPKSAQKRVT